MVHNFGRQQSAVRVSKVPLYEKEEKEASARAEQQRKDRFQNLKELLRRSHIYCSYKKPIHADRCKLWSPYGKLLHWGHDMNVSKADMEWYVRQPGVLFKAITSPAFPEAKCEDDLKIAIC